MRHDQRTATRRLAVGLLTAGVLSVSQHGRAQPAGPERRGDDGAPPTSVEAPESAAAELTPPKLLKKGRVAYPSSVSQGRGVVVVVVRVTIDVTGAVVEAEVPESAGAAFDRAALAAGRASRFLPARRGQRPIRSRASLSFTLVPPEPKPSKEPESPKAPTAAPKPRVADVSGQVLLPGSQAAPIAGADVIVSGPGGLTFQATTDAGGRFTVAGLTAGKYRFSVVSPGIGAADVEVVVRQAGTRKPVVLRLVPPDRSTDVRVDVVGRSRGERKKRSAEAVDVVELEQDKQKTADLGEVLARTKGVGVRRAGGLGSTQRFSLAGLTDDQIRFFMDGIPLDFSGIPFGIANVPVNLIQRLELYQGIVPVRFGSDGLGGAVNLVTDERVNGTHADASYQVGSFGTIRSTLGGSHLDDATGLFVRASGFYDYSRNDYTIDVEVPDDRGRLFPATVRRFHDGYQALGAAVEGGVFNRPWARRLLLRAFATDYDKDIQHNAVMTVPYGDATFGAFTAGATLRYEALLAKRILIDTAGGYSYTRQTFVDVGDCVYDWFGRCVRERRQPGEIDGNPADQVLWDESAFARLGASYKPGPQHLLRLVVSPTFFTRTGDERAQADPAARDPLTAQRDLTTIVSGFEYQAELLERRLQNIVLLKHYAQLLRSEEPLPGGALRNRDRDSDIWGVGNTVRFTIFDWLYAKAGYEWTTRLPDPEEVFGNGVLIVANLELKPERSHNGNLALALDAKQTPLGQLRGEVLGMYREPRDQIVLLGNDRVFSYQNVFKAEVWSVAASAGWTSKGDYLALDGNVTWVDNRNASSEGTFGDFEGDRIPNRPILSANAKAVARWPRVWREQDSLSLEWNTRFVDEYFRGWESVGLREFKQTIDAQLTHSLGVTYLVPLRAANVSGTVEVQNLTDERVFDFFGVQRPGRAAFFKSRVWF